MSVSFLTSENPYTWHGASINLSGVDQSGNLTAPIVTSSNVLCANLYAARALTADNFSGNISANATIEGYLDTTANVTVGTDLVVEGDLTVNGTINGSIANSLTSNVALVAYAVDGGNVTGQVANSAVSTVALTAYAVDGANVSGQVASAAVADVAYSVDAGNVVGQVANAAVSDLALVANSVAGGNVVGQVANAAVSDVALVAYSVDGGNVSGQVAEANISDTANVANALATTGAPVNVSSAAPGTTGQILTLLSPTHAYWADVSGMGVLTQVKVTLSSSDILNLFTTPITLVAAQGAGTVIIVHSTMFVYNYGTVAYAGAGSGSIPQMRVYYSGYSSDTLQGYACIQIKQARDSFRVDGGSGPVSGGGSINTNTISDVTNTAIVIDNDTAAFTSGDGTLDVYLTYEVITL